MASPGVKPPRVVSLLPNATDTIVSLKMAHCLVGRSHECDQKEVADVPVLTSAKVLPTGGDDDDVGTDLQCSSVMMGEAMFGSPHMLIPALTHSLGVYMVDLDALVSLRPDVVLTQLQGLPCEASHGGASAHDLLRAALAAALGYEPRVVHLAAHSLQGCWDDVHAVADAVGAAAAGRQLVQDLERRISAAAAAASGRPKPRVAALQWVEPLFASCSWVPSLIARAGGVDVAGREAEAVALAVDDVAGAAPDVLVVAICGMGIDESVARVRDAVQSARDAWKRVPGIARGRVAVLDGRRLLSRPGPLLAESVEALVEILHPEAQPYGHCGKAWRYADVL